MPRNPRRRSGGRDFERQFEGKEVLDGLLELSGSALNTDDVLARFVAGHAAGAEPSTLIPTLFDGEPQFPDPEIARRLFENLLGLFDLVTSGRKVELATGERLPKEKKKKPEPPAAFDLEEGPSVEYIDAAWRYLEELPEGDARELERLQHGFENRQDALLQWLDEAGLSEEGWATARFLLFELFAMLELGWPGGVGSVPRPWLDAQTPPEPAPEALEGYVEEALFEAEQDEVSPVPAEQIAKVRSLVSRGLRALWNARARS
jgi:hypothetical protein